MSVISSTWVRTSLLVAAAGLMVPTMAEAANYYLHANLTTATFDQKDVWFDDPVAGNTMLDNGDAFAGHNFYSNGFQVRSGRSNFTLGDSTTTLYTNSKLLVRAGPANKITIPNLVREGPSQIAAGSGDVALVVGNLVNDAQTSITGDGTTGRKLSLTVTTLSGAANISLTQRVTLNLSVSDASGFTGTITWGDDSEAVLNFDSPLNSSGSLIAPANARILLDQDVSFTYVKLGDDVLAPGTYQYETLKATYDLMFQDIADSGQWGSITVVPEPAGLMVLASGPVLALRRRRMP